eukprot:5715914-Pyramimonas_sp.AAC.1
MQGVRPCGLLGQAFGGLLGHPGGIRDRLEALVFVWGCFVGEGGRLWAPPGRLPQTRGAHGDAGHRSHVPQARGTRGVAGHQSPLIS